VFFENYKNIDTGPNQLAALPGYDMSFLKEPADRILPVLSSGIFPQIHWSRDV